MKSRNIFISIIFTASYFILAVTAISHHHHQDRLCTEITHCFNESNQNHQHDSEENTDLCIFKTVVTIPDHHSKADVKHLTLKYPLVAYIINPCTSLYFGVVIPRIPNQYPISSPNRFCGIHGLRAPPVA
jgi:hypothetical protein